MSGSSTGPDQFLCKCEKGSTPPRTDKSLYDISNNPQTSFSFITNQTFGHMHQSSGYYTQSDTDKTKAEQSGLPALAATNRKLAERIDVKKAVPGGSYRRVAEHCMQKKLRKDQSPTAPSSPPKDSMDVVGSKKSKQSLRRLLDD